MDNKIAVFEPLKVLERNYFLEPSGQLGPSYATEYLMVGID